MQVADMHLRIGQSEEVVAANLKLIYLRSRPSEMNTSVSLSSSATIHMTTNNICDMFVDQSVNCSNRVVVQQTFILDNALVGTNGDVNSEFNVVKSQMISISFHEDKKELAVSNQTATPIKISIPRNGALQIPTFEYVNKSNTTVLNALNQLLTFGKDIKSANSSIHFNLKPDNLKISYLLVLKYGKVPQVNNLYQDYDYYKIACPHDLLTEVEDNVNFHLLFGNISANKIQSKFVGIGIRELSDNEHIEYCVNRTVPNRIPILNTDSEFDNLTSNYSIRLYTSGCYYFNKDMAVWSTEGVEVLEETTVFSTVCTSTHLTDFAGGFIVLPPAIDFNYVFANASFDKNKTIYLTVIIVTSLYILLFVWCRFMDYQDTLKANIYLLADNNPDDQYFYEIIFYTGGRRNAGTNSKVKLR